MRFLIFLFTVMLLCSVAVADISLNDLENDYYIGQPIYINASISYSKDIYGFFKLELVCPDSEVEYFRKPVLLEENKKEIIEADPITLSNEIVDVDDECYIQASFLNQNDKRLMNEKSDDFDVESGFNVTVELNKKTYKPGDTLVADVFIDVPGGLFSSARVDMIVDKKLSTYDMDDKNLTISYVLPSSASSGKQDVIFQIEDEYGNDEEIEKEITVLSVPSRIVNMFSRTTYYANQANEILRFKPVLYDQGSDLIDDKSVQVRIIDPKGKELVSDSVISTTYFDFAFESNMRPGSYIISSKYEDVTQETAFTVLNADYVESDEPEEEEQPDAEDVVDEDNDTVADDVESEDTDDNESSGDGEEEESSNLWKILAIILIILIILYAVFSFGKSTQKKKDKFKEDKFYGLDKDKKEAKKKEKHPRVIKADPAKHEDDEEL